MREETTGREIKRTDDEKVDDKRGVNRKGEERAQ